MRVWKQAWLTLKSVEECFTSPGWEATTKALDHPN